MKTRFLTVFVLVFTTLFGCKQEEDLVPYDTSKTYIFFNDYNLDGGTTNYINEKSVSFAFHELDVKTIRVGIPVGIIGMPLDQDKEFSVIVDDKETTLSKDLYQIEKPVFHKGLINDSLFVILHKKADMNDKSYALKLTLKENDQFLLGVKNTLSMKLNVSNKLEEPSWWEDYSAFFGPFYSEVYQQWILTYYKGADPTPNSSGERFVYYWDNMPGYFTDLPNDKPILYNHILLVKKYFQDHVVYPNGDTSQPRILLP
ncbi:hypothetical protein GCM10022216_26040 [Sphingobacterium kyonggiense]|uniref:DUF4843 domain-containing protein n=1 Tax=Sphingobacterium kyonggiense TaxID=714075 RepID=A0ABP7YYS5_9SPHI